MMENLKTITFDVIKAENLEPFTLNGKRHLNYHYFHLTDNSWTFLWLQEDTDVTWLKEKIAEGVIYIFKN